MNDMTRVFGEAGPLARSLPGYRIRAGQIDLAQTIHSAIHSNQSLIAEAGTGT